MLRYSWDCAVGIVTDYGWATEGLQFESQYGQKFSLLYIIHSSCGAHPAGTGGSFPKGKVAGT
jgi:hypothetical protein